MSDLNTRERIINAAVELFAERGYTETTMRAIADQVHIKPASIYNHFDSKSDILDYIFNYYTSVTAKHVFTLEELEDMLETDDTRTIIGRMFYFFDDSETQTMLSVLKIIMHEQYREPRVKAYVRDVMFAGAQDYIKNVLDRLIQAGKLSKAVDSRIYAQLFNSTLLVATMQILHDDIKEYRHSSWRNNQLQETINFLLEMIVNTK